MAEKKFIGKPAELTVSTATSTTSTPVSVYKSDTTKPFVSIYRNPTLSLDSVSTTQTSTFNTIICQGISVVNGPFAAIVDGGSYK